MAGAVTETFLAEDSTQQTTPDGFDFAELMTEFGPNADTCAPLIADLLACSSGGGLCALRWKRRSCFLEALNAQGSRHSLPWESRWMCLAGGSNEVGA